MCPICRHRCCQEHIIFLYNVNNKECDCSHNHHNRINNIEKLLLDMETEITQKKYDKEQQYESKLKTHTDYICSIEQRYSELIQWSNEQGQTILSLQKEITELLIQEQRYGSKLKTQSDYIRSIETRYN
jgi:septal ring factor EnvC (AmiA/AmiB activator)